MKAAQGLTWYIRFSRDGKRPRIAVGLVSQYATEAKASRAAQHIRDEFNQPSVRQVWTFGDVIARYEREEMPERYSTRRGYMQIHRLYLVPAFGAALLADMEPMRVRAWLQGLELATRTKGHIHGQLRVLYKFAMLWGWLPATVNPMSLFSIKGSTKRTRKPRVITPAQFRQLLSGQTDIYVRTMLIGAYCLGLRASELFALMWKDFDHLGGRVRVCRAIVDGRVGPVKTERSDAPLPLHDIIGKAFLALRGASQFNTDDHFVFASPWQGGEAPFNSQHTQVNVLVPAGEGIGLDFSLGWHTFRHSYKVLLERAGADITVQRDLMRHADAHTTMQVYGIVEFDRMRDANDKAVELAFKEVFEA